MWQPFNMGSNEQGGIVAAVLQWSWSFRTAI